MAQSITIPLLTVPNLEPQRSPTKRINSLDDVTKLAPELNREYLTIEDSSFAKGAFSDIFGGRWTPPEHPEGIDVAIKVLRIAGQVTDPGPALENKRYGQLCQAVEGLIHLHTFQPYPVIHLDIKPSNILVTDKGDAELCDFGYAKVLGGASTGFTTSPNPGGTYPYMSPEVLDGVEWQGLTPAADIFGLGSTIIYILSGKRAWDSIKAKGTLMMRVMNGIPPAREEYTMDGSEEAINKLWDLLVCCWNKDPKYRPSSQEVLDTLLAIEAMGGVRPVIPMNESA
ncbi:Suppressor of Sensor Kinase (SLN1) [Tulasnella sp. 425]|nr:Suppressor of Sensor Kinase (SLN1) [Tulasnella sp. 425]